MDNTLRHLACIMDGNRRYAKVQGMPAFWGHREGTKTVKMVIEYCLQQSIPYLSLYTFSLENFKRNALETDYVWNIMTEYLDQYAHALHEQRIKINFIGDITRFPHHVQQAIQTVQELTQYNERLHMQLLFGYGSRQEIIAAVKTIAHRVAAGVLSQHDITDDIFRNELWSHAFPDPDLIVRTGGVHRLSNFLLYQAAYSEFYFTDTFWPALTRDELSKAVDGFYSTTRNYGS
jgi:undecaprenyl diphosphate synthase